MFKLDPEKESKVRGWISALASDKYPQCITMMYNGQETCALGLAHKLYFPTIPRLVSPVGAAIGLTAEGTMLVVDWNDCEELSFPEISRRLNEAYEREKMK